MRVYGKEICEIEINKLAIDFIGQVDTFRSHNLKVVVESRLTKGMGIAVTDRCADRLAQRWRKSGYIVFRWDYWIVKSGPFTL